MLERSKIGITLYLETVKDKDGEFIAHAWLRSGFPYITGLEGMEKFTIVRNFSKEISNEEKK